MRLVYSVITCNRWLWAQFTVLLPAPGDSGLSLQCCYLRQVVLGSVYSVIAYPGDPELSLYCYLERLFWAQF